MDTEWRKRVRNKNTNNIMCEASSSSSFVMRESSLHLPPLRPLVTFMLSLEASQMHPWWVADGGVHLDPHFSLSLPGSVDAFADADDEEKTGAKLAMMFRSSCCSSPPRRLHETKKDENIKSERSLQRLTVKTGFDVWRFFR